MVALDTLSVSQDLEAAGMAREHAEAVAHAVASAGEAARGDLAAKADLERVELGLRADLERVELGLKADLAAFETRMVRFGYGLALAVVGLNVAAVFGLLKLLS